MNESKTIKYMVWLYHKKALGYSNMLQVGTSWWCRPEAGPGSWRIAPECRAPGTRLRIFSNWERL